MINKIKSIYGPKPKLVKWAYTGIIRPKINYGEMIWGNKIKLKKHEHKLQQINRTALKGYTKFMHSTPTAALEIMTPLTPFKTPFTA